MTTDPETRMISEKDGVKVRNVLDKPIRDLLSDVKRFVERANRTLKRHEHYEPNPDQSHLWAWLQSAVEQAADVIEEVQL